MVVLWFYGKKGEERVREFAPIPLLASPIAPRRFVECAYRRDYVGGLYYRCLFSSCDAGHVRHFHILLVLLLRTYWFDSIIPFKSSVRDFGLE